MSIGIYKLIFEGTAEVYIGQSINIESRFKDHLNTLKSGKGVPKLQEAYNKYGIPSLNIVEECKSNLLNSKEIYYIKIHNSMENGFNSLSGGDSYYGEDNSNSKYTNEDYYMVLWYLTQIPTYTHEEISLELNISISVIRSISRGLAHEWLQEIYPEEYKEMQCINNTGRRSNINLGKDIPIVVSPEGIEYSVPNVFQFSKNFGLHQPGLHRLISGDRKQYRGWHMKGALLPKPYPTIISPLGDKYTIEYGKAKEFASKYELEYSCLHDVLTYKAKTHRGWRLEQ